MGTMPVGKLLLSMSLPMIASMLGQAFYNVVDTVFVSYIPYEGDGASPAVAALSIAFIVQNLQIAVGVGTGVGVNALISRNLGKKDFAAANAIAANGMFLAICNLLLEFINFFLIGVIYHYTGYKSTQGNDHNCNQNAAKQNLHSGFSTFYYCIMLLSLFIHSFAE